MPMNRVIWKCLLHRDFVVQRCSSGCENKDVWSWRPDAGVKPATIASAIALATVTKRPVTGESAK
jgi:hypothetical protein